MTPILTSITTYAIEYNNVALKYCFLNIYCSLCTNFHTYQNANRLLWIYCLAVLCFFFIQHTCGRVGCINTVTSINILSFRSVVNIFEYKLTKYRLLFYNKWSTCSQPVLSCVETLPAKTQTEPRLHRDIMYLLGQHCQRYLTHFHFHSRVTHNYIYTTLIIVWPMNIKHYTIRHI